MTLALWIFSQLYGLYGEAAFYYQTENRVFGLLSKIQAPFTERPLNCKL
jgi:hypothetical protein